MFRTSENLDRIAPPSFFSFSVQFFYYYIKSLYSGLLGISGEQCIAEFFSFLLHNHIINIQGARAMAVSNSPTSVSQYIQYTKLNSTFTIQVNLLNKSSHTSKITIHLTQQYIYYASEHASTFTMQFKKSVSQYIYYISHNIQEFRCGTFMCQNRPVCAKRDLLRICVRVQARTWKEPV